MIKHYRLTSEKHTVNAKITANGDDWQVEIITHENGADSVPWEVCYRYYSTLQGRADNGIMGVSRKLRREFGITGAYIPMDPD